MNKQVKKQEEVKFYFTVVDLLREGNSLREVASRLGISKQLLNIRILPLKIDGIIIKKGYGVWDVNKSRLKEFLEQKEVKKSDPHAPIHIQNLIRGHAFIFTIKIPLIDYWHDRKTFLEKEGIAYQEKR